MCKHIYRIEPEWGCPPERRHCDRCAKNCSQLRAVRAYVGQNGVRRILSNGHDRITECPYCGDLIPKDDKDIPTGDAFQTVEAGYPEKMAANNHNPFISI